MDDVVNKIMMYVGLAILVTVVLFLGIVIAVYVLVVESGEEEEIVEGDVFYYKGERMSFDEAIERIEVDVRSGSNVGNVIHDKYPNLFGDLDD